MNGTFSNTAEGRRFVANGTTALEHLSHTLDLSGAALATSAVASALGDAATARTMRALSGNALLAFNASSCLLRQDGTYYEGTCARYERMARHLSAETARDSPSLACCTACAQNACL